ncbi:MAG TPA: DUF3592 domain-containing protein [Pseudonocardiaceae bacterium]|nr:DUF3592 domain-containing protein [Pseudonocardiaceae bacterium]
MLLWTLFAVTLVALVAMIVVTLVEQFDPNGGSTPGTVVVTSCQGQGTNTQCYGDFHSTDGRTSLSGTRIFGEDFAKVGQTFTVYYDPSSKSITALTSGQNLSTNLIFVGLLLVLALVQFWFRIMVPRQRRKAQLVADTIADLRRRHENRSQ